MNDDDDEEVSGSSDGEYSEVESDEEVVEEVQEDPLVAAERAKEEGNVQFKQGRYGNAIDLYTKAHGMCSLDYFHKLLLN